MSPADWRRLATIAEECTEWDDDPAPHTPATTSHGFNGAKFVVALRKEAERVEVIETAKCPKCGDIADQVNRDAMEARCVWCDVTWKVSEP